MLLSVSLQAAPPRSLSHVLKSACPGRSSPPTASLSFCQSAAVGQAGSPGRTRFSRAPAAIAGAGNDEPSASRGRAATLFKRFLRCMDPSLQRGPAAAALRCSADCLHRLDQLRRHLLRISVEHARVVEIEERILDAGETRALATLDDD